MKIADKFGMAFTIGIVIITVTFAATGGTLSVQNVEYPSEVIGSSIDPTVPQIIEKSIDEVEDTIEENLPKLLESTEGIEEAIEEAEDIVEEIAPETPIIIQQMEGEHIEMVSIPAGTSVPGCELTNTCFIPHVSKLSENGEVIWTNHDSIAHTVTSGNPQDGPTSFFDSGLIVAGDTYSKTFPGFIEGEIDYFCLVHPWMEGKIIIQ